MTPFNAFDLAKDLNGSTTIDGVEYAIGQDPSFTNYKDSTCYKSYGFTRQDLDQGGDHDPLFDTSVSLVWVDGGSTDEYQGNWETDAIIGSQL